MKEANTKYPLLEVIKKRWSPRAFANKEVATEKLQQIFEAARWAPSSGNGQPWRFIVTQKGSDAFENMLDTLAEGNKVWAKEAPILILAVAETTLAREGKPSRENRHAFHDVGQAVANMSLQAINLDLYLHQMAGFSFEKAQKVFEIPPEFTPVTVIALGYLGTVENLPESFRELEQAPRNRKPLSELIFSDKWH